MAAPERLGDFQIGDEIGRGGFGIVYRAQQVSLDRPVAVKVLFRHLIHTQDEITRFEREARAAARLDHPAIVSVYAWGQDKDDFFIAQRLVGRGRTLADELTDLRKLGSPPKGHFRRVAEVIARIAEGLQQAHDRGIVHRDVKPSNILLDEHEQPCLGDFGLAKIEDGVEVSRTGDFAGSPYFMSPEQADGKRGSVDHRSDIYSLGVTLYELLTLTQPFQGATAHEIVRRILSEDPRRPRRIEPRVPADLETICLKAIEKNPQLRYPSALEFAHDLRAFLDGEPISAVPIGYSRRLLRSARRHREPVAYGLLVTLLVVGGLWASTALSKSTRQVDRAEAETLVQRGHVEEIGQLQQTFNEKIQQAAAEQDPQKVSALVQQQQDITRTINDNYAWVTEQLKEMGDSDGLKRVATGVATGGLYGGFQSLQQVILTRKAAQERDSLMSEVTRRMGEISEYLMANGDDVAAGGLQSSAGGSGAGTSPRGTPLRLVPTDGQWLLLFRGQSILLPATWLVPNGDANAQQVVPGAEPATGSVSGSRSGLPGPDPPLEQSRVKLPEPSSGGGWLRPTTSSSGFPRSP